MNGSTRVLIAEDDPLVRTVLLTIAGEFSTEVKEAITGQEAMSILTQERFDLLITDFRMPGANGLEVLKTAVRLHAARKMLLISGYADEETQMQVEALGATLLHKPFGAEALRQAIREALT